MPQRTYDVVELLGDGISSELSESLHAVAEQLPFALRFHTVDLSLASRESEGPHVLYHRAEELLRRHRAGVKYPTETRKESPNAKLREHLGFSVIHRPVASIPGIPTLFRRPLDLHIVRVATGGTYEDAGRRVGSDAAISVRIIEAKPCSEAAAFAFDLASKLGCDVVSSSKWTIQRATDGLFEDCVSQVASRHPNVKHRRELFDSLLAKLVLSPESFRVIVTPNEYGDFLSDLACGLVGSMGLGDSASYAFSDDGKLATALFDPAGGTAPDIAGKDLANPTATLFALSSLLRFLGEDRSGDAVKSAALAAIAAGERTRDLGGTLGTRAFTAAVIRHLTSALRG